jgi:hypothetical protein
MVSDNRVSAGGGGPPGGGGHGSRLSAAGGGGGGPFCGPCGGGAVEGGMGIIGGAESGWLPIDGDCMVAVGGCAGAAPTGAASRCPQLTQNCVPGCTEYPQDGHHEPSILTIASLWVSQTG